MSVPVAEERMVSGHTTVEFTRFVIPSVTGLLSVSSANIVDGIFVGNYVGATALAGVNLAIPLFSLFFGICVMLLVGSAVIAGKALGEGNIRQASNIFTKALCVVSVYALLMTFMTEYYAEHIALFLGAQGDVLTITTSYIHSISPFLLFMGITYALAYFAKVDDAPNHALAGFIITAVSNIALDYLFIKVMGWGVVGAGLATGSAYIFSSGFLIARLLKSRKVRIRLIVPFGRWSELLRAAYNGFSEFINELSGGLVMFVINWILMLEIGIEGVAAFTIVNYTIWLSIMVSYGVAEALGPLISVNFGAKMPDRIRQFTKLGVIVSTMFGMALVAILLTWPETLASAFLGENDHQTLTLTLTIISIIWPMFLFNGLSITLSGYFTGMQCATQSTVIALSRSLVLPLGLMVMFWKLFGVNGAFVALPVAEVLTFALSAFLLYCAQPERLIDRDSNTPGIVPAAA